MFANLTERLSKAANALRGRGRLTEDNIAETLQIDPDRIEIVQGDSDVAQGIGSMGSRSLYIGGSAMQTASQQAIDEGRER